MTVHIISVGLSILDSLADPDPDPGGRKKLRLSPELVRLITRHNPQDALKLAGADADGDQASAWIASVLADLASPLHDQQAARQFAALAGAVKPRLWPAPVSAELSTFGSAEGATIPVRARDTAVLVCSHTACGLLAGLWNAVALGGGTLSRVSYLADPGDALGDVPGRVFVVRVTGLDAGSESGFSKAMKGLGTLGRSLLDSPQVGAGDAFRFYLSGGYKATIPYLIGLAEGVRSAGGKREVDAYVLHETGGSGAIRLPLRRMIARQVGEELGGFDAHTRTCPDIPGARLLEGYAYERSGTGWKLTPFGDGLTALFPGPHERIRPR